MMGEERQKRDRHTQRQSGALIPGERREGVDCMTLASPWGSLSFLSKASDREPGQEMEHKTTEVYPGIKGDVACGPRRY